MPSQRKVAFAGKTEEGEEIVLYYEDPAVYEDEKSFVLSRPTNRVSIDRREFFLKLPNGEVWALSPYAEITVWDDEDPSTYATHVKIESPEWSGTAKGTREDLLRIMRAEGIHL